MIVGQINENDFKTTPADNDGVRLMASKNDNIHFISDDVCHQEGISIPFVWCVKGVMGHDTHRLSKGQARHIILHLYISL